ncbi:fumarylacetoacetate hydrolase family protein [Desulfofundulus sp.]|uniref:fumarylacetoacetate hydrolase family protein n=1 Tax=Desulfofundulus sp. TaxID=2282750 RepID=UPI003C7581A0
MRIGRFSYRGEIFCGLVEDDMVLQVADPFQSLEPVPGRQFALPELDLLAPCLPTKAVCVGLNYRDHALEVGMALPEEPVLFLKPSTAVIGPGEPVVYPAMSRQVDYEAELAVVIGKKARHVREEEAAGYILGYTCANDITARDLQKKDGQWTRAKSFDTFLPLGPYIVTGVDPGDREVSLYLNGERKQHSSTSQLIFPVYRLLSFISRIMTLLPGDVILTGTPAGVGPVQPGDTVEVVISGIGRLVNVIVPGT